MEKHLTFLSEHKVLDVVESRAIYTYTISKHADHADQPVD